jgi:hypothetical protein
MIAQVPETEIAGVETKKANNEKYKNTKHSASLNGKEREDKNKPTDHPIN